MKCNVPYFQKQESRERGGDQDSAKGPSWLSPRDTEFAYRMLKRSETIHFLKLITVLSAQT